MNPDDLSAQAVDVSSFNTNADVSSRSLHQQARNLGFRVEGHPIHPVKPNKADIVLPVVLLVTGNWHPNPRH